jgi:predicted nucleotidyltransferase
MGFKEVLTRLNDLRATGIIQDYAIGGGYAATFYDIPMFTYDLDVLVVLPTENDYHRLYEHFRTKGAKIEKEHIFIEGMPVQFFPNYISPLYNSAIEAANIVDFQGVSSKFVSIEYLIALYLTAFRRKDIIRVQSLIKKANKKLLLDIIRRFDNEQYKLYERYKRVLADT